MIENTPDVDLDQLLLQIAIEGAKLKEHTEAASAVREDLYPMLYEANVGGKVSLAQLQQRTGLTRGRIHQIVNLVKARKAEAGVPETAPETAPVIVVERSRRKEHPVSVKAGWGGS